MVQEIRQLITNQGTTRPIKWKYKDKHIVWSDSDTTSLSTDYDFPNEIRQSYRI